MTEELEFCAATPPALGLISLPVSRPCFAAALAPKFCAGLAGRFALAVKLGTPLVALPWSLDVKVAPPGSLFGAKFALWLEFNLKFGAELCAFKLGAEARG